MFSDLSELLLDSIILLLHDGTQDTKKLVSKLVELVADEKHAHLFTDPELIQCLAKLTSDLLKQEDSTSKAEQAEVLIRFATNATLLKYPSIQTNLEIIFSNNEEMSQARIRRLFLKLKNQIAWHTCNTFTKKIFGQLNRISTSTDEEQQEFLLSSVINLAKDMVEAEARNLSQTDKSVIERIDMGNVDSIMPAIQKYKMTETLNVLKTPLQGFNLMCGKRGGLALGESVTINALPGMFKSGLLKLLAYGITQINIPSPELSASGIPLILFISLENEANKDMMWWYRQMYAAQYGALPDNLDDIDIAKYVADKFGSCGYKFLIERRLGANFGFDEYCLLVEELEAIGYRLGASFIDYLKLMKLTSKNSTSEKQNHLALGRLMSNMCNFNRTKSITQVSAHPLNREASNLAYSGKQNVVKMFGENVMADSMDIQREVDLSIMLHLERNQHNQRFMTVKRDKHRYVDDTPIAHQYFAYQFNEFGIMPDYAKEAGFVRDIYAVPDPDGGAITESTDDTSQELFG